MGRRSNYTNDQQMSFLGLVDKVALDTKPFFVGQEDEHWPPYVEIDATRYLTKQPRYLASPGDARKPQFLADIFPQMRTHKFCSACGDWVIKSDFSPNERNADKLQSWCKPCRNRHAKRMYWHSKNTMIQ